MMAAIFPGLAACQEHQAGPIEIPDHPLVRQTLHDCLHEAMDIEGLTKLVRGFQGGDVKTHFVDTTEPSPLAHEILSGRPYTFLDGRSSGRTPDPRRGSCGGACLSRPESWVASIPRPSRGFSSRRVRSPATRKSCMTYCSDWA